MVNWFLIRMTIQFNRETVAFPTNGTGETGYPHIKEWSGMPTTDYISKNLLKID